MSSVRIEWIPIRGGNWVCFQKRVFECLIISRSILSGGTRYLLEVTEMEGPTSVLESGPSAWIRSVPFNLDLDFSSAIDTIHNENEALCERVKGRLILCSALYHHSMTPPDRELCKILT